MSNRLDKDREEKLQPKRMQIALNKIRSKGFDPVQIDETKLEFLDKASFLVTYYPYSGWATGKNIKDGRGLMNLLKQI